MEVDHARDIFHGAIRTALASNATLQERLSGLISSVGQLQRDDFPDENVWADFRKLVTVTTRRGIRNLGEEGIQVTSLQLSDKEASDTLQAAFDIFSHLADASGISAFRI